MSGKTNTDRWADVIWSLFSSVKLTVVVLLLLAATSIIGTLIPQNQPEEFYYMKYGLAGYNLIRGLNILDMYHSWWFRMMIVVLSMNIVVCSLDRLPAVWKIVKKQPDYDVERFRKYKARQEFSVNGTWMEKRDVYRSAVSRKFASCRIEETPSGFVLFGEKGRYSRLGVYIVHASVLLLLLGSLVGSLAGFDGSISLPVGETTDKITLKNSTFTQPLGFTIRCDNFQKTEYDNGMVKEYRSDLTLLEDGKEVLRKSIVVNDPLHYKGINIFQASYGTLGGNEATLSFLSKKSGMVYDRTVKAGQAIELPENMGTFTLVDFTESYPFMDQDIGACYIGKITAPGAKDQDVVLPLQFKMFDRMRKGDVVVSLVDFKKTFFTGLQITHDPGVPLVYLAFVLMIIGCYIAFFMSHQSLCVEVVDEKNGSSRVMVSGTANKNRMGMTMTVNKIASYLQTLK